MELFLSKYSASIDKKNRVSIPAFYRGILGDGVVIYPSIKNNCLEGCTLNRLEELSDIINVLDPYSEERDAFETIILGESTYIPFDTEGRVVLPKTLSENAGIIDQACFVGKGKVFEIWNPSDFDSYLAKAKEIAKSNRNLLKNV
jgi:MraZ protein